MNRMRLLPMGVMIIVTAVALGMAGKMYWAAGLVIAATLAHLVLGLQIRATPRLVVMVVLAVPFALLWRQTPRPVIEPIYLMLLAGMYLQTLAVYHLLCHRHGGKLNHALACVIVGMAAAGTVRHFTWLLPLFLVFAACLMIFLRQRLRDPHSLQPARGRVWPRAWRYTLALILVVGLTIGLNWVAAQSIPRVNQWAARQMVARMFAPDSMAFTTRTQLGTVRQQWQDGDLSAVALRVWADTPPGYLRQAVYDQYQAGTWSMNTGSTPLPPVGHDDGRMIFDALERRTGGPAVGMIYPTHAFAHAYYLPMEVHRISSFGRHAHLLPGRVLRPQRREAMGGYAWHEADVDMDDPGRQLLDVPDQLHEPLAAFLEKATAGAQSPQEKALRLQTYFQEHFRYDLAVDLRGEKDPLLTFLFDQRAGHCEWFATAAVLLLRQAGVHARYVTGLLVHEPGPTGGYYIARRRDAHAWVEAWTPQTGWQIVEPTPASARPTISENQRASTVGEFLASLWQRVSGVVRYGGFLGVLGLLWAWILKGVAAVPLALWGLLLGVALLWIFRESLRHWWRGPADDGLTAEARILQAQLRRVEKQLAGHALERPPAMSVQRFLERVRQAADLPTAARQQAVRDLEHYQHLRFARVTTRRSHNAEE